jgi:competence ComEA-like helix-hairpin-helix protein
MNILDIKSKIKSLTMMTGAELTAVFVILSGLAVGLIFNATSGNSNHKNSNNVDSLQKQLISSVTEQFRDSAVGIEVKEMAIVNEIAPESDLLADAKEITLAKSEDKPEIAPKVTSNTSKLIDINKASRVQLMRLPGIGEITAEKIIEHRNSNPFSKPEDIMDVRGIGPKKFEKMKDMIEVR